MPLTEECLHTVLNQQIGEDRASNSLNSTFELLSLGLHLLRIMEEISNHDSSVAHSRLKSERKKQKTFLKESRKRRGMKQLVALFVLQVLSCMESTLVSVSGSNSASVSDEYQPYEIKLVEPNVVSSHYLEDTSSMFLNLLTIARSR